MSQLARKGFHASGVLIVVLWQGTGMSRGLAAALLWIAVGLLLLVDLLRYRNPDFQSRFRRAFRLFLDRKDLRGLNGSTLYMGGCAIAATLFPAESACPGILALALGDSMAAVVGSSVPSPRFGRVSLAGSLACFVVSSAACLLFVPWPRALFGGAVCTILEAVSGSKLDNLTLPVGVAAALHFL